MPNYGFACTHCGTKSEKFMYFEDYHEIDCPQCGMQTIWDVSQNLKNRPFKAFTTTHIDGKPMEIGSLHELRQIEKRHGVNFPVYGGSMLSVDVENHKNYVDESGITHRG